MKDAIENAALAIDPDGKMNRHQWRIGKKLCGFGLENLLAQYKRIQQSKSFDDIFKITEEVRLVNPGLGDLWSYDTALRIGFKLGYYPIEVFVQRGVIKGAQKALKEKYIASRKLPLKIFPVEIQSLKPYEAENFLCIWGKGNLIAC